jgi:trimeric autotransporter adhesin
MIIPVAIQKERPSMQRVSCLAQRRPWMRGLTLIVTLAALVSWLPALAAGPATLLKNINTTGGIPFTPDNSSSPQRLVAISTQLFFSADDGTSGRELWTSDGTTGNTKRVKNINSGSDASDPADLVELNGQLFFSADDGSGRTIWQSDGSNAGTDLITDTTVFSAAAELTRSGDSVFFSAADSTNGRELWKTAGAISDTLLVKDINTATASANPTDLTDVNGTLFFAATEPISGTELWRSDGTPQGTRLVADINPLAGAPSAPANLTAAGNTLFFTADDGVNGVELWKSDGSLAGTVLVKDINSTFPGAIAAPANLTAVGNMLFFTANNGVNGIELWKSDGTPAGTVQVKDIYAGAFDAAPTNLTTVGSTLYFSANDGVSGIELWKSDGTPAGTVQVKDIYPGAPDAELSQLASINGTLLFAANDGVNGVELWKSKGTPETTLLVQNIASGAGASNPGAFTLLGNSALFRANDDSTGAELWSLPIGGLNFAPVATSTTFSTGTDTPVNGTLPASDPDGNPLSFSLVANGTKGSAAITNAGTGAFIYTPNLGATGTDSFSFKASDGALESNVATVTITIGALNSAPVAGSALITTAFNLQYSGTLGASDPEGSPLVFSIVTNGSKGVARIVDAATGAFTYTPNAGATGTDSFSFKASDGALESNVATVTVTIGNPKVYLPMIVR